MVQDLVRLGLVIGLDQDTTIFLLPEKGYRMENTTNESTTGADASVEMPKLHNIKLLIAFMHMINNLILLHAKKLR